MANNYTSLKLSHDTAYRFKEDLSSTTHPVVQYVFLGNSIPYANGDTTIPEMTDTSAAEKEIWDNMYFGKKATGNDISLVVPMVRWTGDTKYKQYDDKALLANLISPNTSINLKPMYVLTSDYNVYKCLSNNNSANSTVEPIGDYTSGNGFITTGDSYVWKYMYNVRPSNKFLTDEWLPTPTSIDEQQYTMSQANLIDGALAAIIVTNGGSGYVDSNVNCAAFGTGVTTISLDTLSNVAANMSVSGTGIIGGTYITDIDVVTGVVTLSLPTTANGGGTGNTISLSTRVYVGGDGNNDYAAKATIANGAVEKIKVITIGTGYTRANAFIYGTGSNATARVVLPPKLGHGFNPAREFMANSAMVSMRIGHLDSTEGGLISSNTSFRQYGLLSAPHKYGETTKVPVANANSAISQTTDVTVVAGFNYNINEFVYQGLKNNPYFSGVVHSYDTNIIRLINVKGTPVIGGIMTGNTSLSARAVVSYESPEFEPYTGSILYAENAPKVARAEGQAENVKFVIKF